ncbi:protein-disulfide reductase DsbD domain-containing protein [Pedobacter frigoris]|uniref:Sugar transporter n=1 Tax=Pedobacter frigoris TaxID=2571272 RepID=A0A4U1CJR9_9SPHI|nr:protein-disulfide reductase DsbD domain-containing protein [Pedobacter frigoris]TKC07683.1 sugar transporter [Pedobacter frigoris]
MRKIQFLLVVILFATVSQAQILKPVKWSFSAAAVKGKAGVYKVSMTAVVDKGWHIYAQNTPDGGPSATKVTFTKNPLVLLGGKTTEVGKLHKEHSKEFGVDVLSYSDKVEFVQVVKVKILRKALNDKNVVLKGTVEFMACDESQCLPPAAVGFEIELK